MRRTGSAAKKFDCGQRFQIYLCQALRIILPWLRVFAWKYHHLMRSVTYRATFAVRVVRIRKRQHDPPHLHTPTGGPNDDMGKTTGAVGVHQRGIEFR